MLARVFSAIMVVLALISAYLQLNDPDPERWTAIYLGCAVVAVTGALGRPVKQLSLLVGAIALLWALAIVPELLGRWRPDQLTATMTAEHPEIEFGRECAGLLIVFGFCLFNWLWARRREVRA
jgi:predicted permease